MQSTMCNFLAFHTYVPAAGTLAQGLTASQPRTAAVAASLLSSMIIIQATSRHPFKGSQYKATLCSSNRPSASFPLARWCDSCKLILRLQVLYTFHHRFVHAAAKFDKTA